MLNLQQKVQLLSHAESRATQLAREAEASRLEVQRERAAREHQSRQLSELHAQLDDAMAALDATEASDPQATL